METASSAIHHEPWNKGRIVGQKAPFKLKDIWALRVRLQMEGRVRELALFNLGIESKLRGCDLVALKVRDVCHGEQVASRAIVLQHNTQRPVQFEITAASREALAAWIKQARLRSDDFLFPSRLHESPHLGTRQYARILGHWVAELGSTARTTGRTHATDEGDSDLSTDEDPARCNCCSGTPSSNRPCDTSALRSMTPSKSPSRQRSEQRSGCLCNHAEAAAVRRRLSGVRPRLRFRPTAVLRERRLAGGHRDTRLQLCNAGLT